MREILLESKYRYRNNTENENNGGDEPMFLKDRYEGDIDPPSKLRHGYGTYQYPNKYF